MKAISLATSVRAAKALKSAARKADTDKSGFLDRRELRLAKAKVGTAAAKALNAYAGQYRAGIKNDPEIPSWSKPREMALMDVSVIDYSVDAGVAQLKRIDTYRGNQREQRPANNPDTFVQPWEVKNYARTGGRLQMEARPLAAFTVSLQG